MTAQLPIKVPEATPIGTFFSMVTCDGTTTYFHYLLPIDQHRADDRSARNLRIAKFAAAGCVTHAEIARAYGIRRETVSRFAKQYRTEGEPSFYARRRGRGRVTVDAQTVQRASELLVEGCSGRATARQLGIAPSTFSEHRRAGIITPPASRTALDDQPSAAGQKDSDIADMVDRAVRDRRDKQAPMGRAAHDVDTRLAASAGLITEAAPQFTESASAVRNGGVLTALPALLKQGLLDNVGHHFQLSNGFYGLNTVLVLIALMMLARIRNPEALRYQCPGEWGILLGLDRCPEVKTLRGKLRKISCDESRVRAWQGQLAQRWINENPHDCATLSVDGHVKVYSGRKGNLPKHFVARQKLCLPAAASYWINALGGMPLLCLHQQIDRKMVHTLEHDMLPELRCIGAIPQSAPDLTAAEAEPVLTLVFDREGWSPDLFQRLARQGIACISWHKNHRGADWLQSRFEPVEVSLHGPAHHSVRSVLIAEDEVELANGYKVRQIRRLMDSGRQAALITTHPNLPMQQVVAALFSRWAQENFFKQMRQEFNLDALSVQQLIPVDENAKVVNPDRRELEKRIKNTNAKRSRAVVQMIQFRNQNRDATQYERTAQQYELELVRLKAQRLQIPSHMRAGDLPQHQRLDALPSAPRHFLDIIRMIAYRAETQMMPAVNAAQGKKHNARKLLGKLFQCEANVIPQPEQGLLRVQLLGLANDASDRALLPLIKELNETAAQYPGTDLTLFYEISLRKPVE